MHIRVGDVTPNISLGVSEADSEREAQTQAPRWGRRANFSSVPPARHTATCTHPANEEDGEDQLQSRSLGNAECGGHRAAQISEPESFQGETGWFQTLRTE